MEESSRTSMCMMDDGRKKPHNIPDGKMSRWTKLEDICPYKTTYQISHKYMRAPYLLLEKSKPELCQKLVENDLLMQSHNYESLYSKDFTLKFGDNDVMKKSLLPSARHYKFMKSFDEKMQSVPMRRLATSSEYKEKYPSYQEKEPVNGELKDFHNTAHCKIVGLTRGDQPRIPLEVESAGKYADPYVSQCQIDYTYKAPLVVQKLNYVHPDLSKSTFPSAPSAAERSQFDSFLYRTQDKRIDPMISVTTEDYRRELTPAEPRAVNRVLCLRQTKGDVLRTPAMYHTEYSHIGSNWHSDILVDHY